MEDKVKTSRYSPEKKEGGLVGGMSIIVRDPRREFKGVYEVQTKKQ